MVCRCRQTHADLMTNPQRVLQALGFRGPISLQQTGFTDVACHHTMLWALTPLVSPFPCTCRAAYSSAMEGENEARSEPYRSTASSTGIFNVAVCLRAGAFDGSAGNKLTRYVVLKVQGGFVSVALSLGSPPVAVSNCPSLCCPDCPLHAKWSD